jgi:hypothetical protein
MPDRTEAAAWPVPWISPKVADPEPDWLDEDDPGEDDGWDPEHG